MSTDKSVSTVRSLTFERPSENRVLVRITGEWKLKNSLPTADEVMKEMRAGQKVRQIAFDAGDLKGWDSGLLTFLIRVMDLCSAADIAVEKDGLPKGVQRLLSLATAVPERKGARREAERISFVEKVGDSAIAFWRSILEMLEFIGEASVAFVRVFTGKAKFRPSDLFLTIQECGAQALPIVSLISLLVGLILAFIGAIQLKIFGAQIYVASLVGIGMVRALAAVMTGIIMAGRTGAAFAAQLGTMQVNEEIDALKTLGVSPMEFLVLPRMLALFFMMPLLSLYADLMGVLGGLIIGVSMLDLNFMEYFIKTRESVSMNDLWVGVFSAAVFGVLVALAGCMRGMQCGRSASAVGEATTSAVVTSIVSIVVAMALITVVCNVLHI
ncbi:MAG TPA: ABC transporter permease [Thermodesulfovibrionales bacterium]|nr:ABC transporter permease [Thermodesulfovibrionales bacterium]